MTMSGIPGLIPSDLIEHLSKGDCVLFVGDELDGRSQSQLLATALVHKGRLHSACPMPVCQAQRKCAMAGQCAIPFHRAAQLYESLHGRYSLVRCVRDLVEAEYPSLPVPPILRVVASLPTRTMITTAYDRRLEEALRQAGRKVNAVIKDANVPLDDPDRVQLIYLRGRLDQPDESLTLTSDDAADLFGRLPTVATILRGQFASKTALFLGYGLIDPYFENLYQQVSRPIGNLMRRAYGVQWPADPLGSERWRRKIDLVNIPPLDFVSELHRLVHIQKKKERRVSLPPEPYKFLDYYTADDTEIFFGRDLESELLLSTILAYKFSVFYGRSGTGKTSLLLARVAPALQQAGYRMIYARMLSDPTSEVKAAVRGVPVNQLTYADRGRRLADVLADAASPTDRLVVVLDQFEEFFIRQGDQLRREFAQEMAECLWPQTAEADHGKLDLRFVLSLRDDYLGALDELGPFLPQDVFAHRYKLEGFTREKAHLAMIKPADAFGLPVEDTLQKALLTDLEDQGLEPTNFQIVLYSLYQDAIRQGLWSGSVGEGIGLTLARYQALGQTRQLLARYLDRVLDELPTVEKLQHAQAVLKSMVTAEHTKAVVSGREIARGALVAKLGLAENDVDALLDYLRERRVVRKFGDEPEGRYELAHEVMVQKVWGWLSEDELRIVDLRDMLRREMGDYKRFAYLLSPQKLELVNEHREELSLDAEEAELLLRSALASGSDVMYWFRRALERGVSVDSVATEGLLSDNFRTRASAVAALGQLTGLFTDRIVAMLSDSYPQVRVAAIKVLEHAQLDVDWRKHLSRECYTPAGEFTIGDGGNESDDKGREVPSHVICLGAFYIGKYPVTNTDYKRFMDDVGRPFDVPDGKADHPVTNVNWFEAREYTTWASMRLLTEAEWEKAASWDPDTEKRRRTYPWGDTASDSSCNSLETGIGDTTPVRAYSPRGDSASGCSDMAGNVWEWCNTAYQSYPYEADDGRETKTGIRTNMVQRGGSFINTVTSVRCSCRGCAQTHVRSKHVGFRVGWSDSLPFKLGVLSSEPDMVQT